LFGEELRLKCIAIWFLKKQTLIDVLLGIFSPADYPAYAYSVPIIVPMH